ncbi:hypothetical protein HFN60_30475 [Rhizobium leguminosarum]|uniref:hypothetical protein n=1 Tax=Rhizobium leguminosarum TaxID=384 RepID=UPI001C94228A|nr:hypothetical protein [Rhizobium leguminosarum]MBY5819919.1 hypothetical protein [Rhizobium leguminosarum]
MFTVSEAAERLGVIGLDLMHIVDVGDLRPTVCVPREGSVWHPDAEIAFSEDDLGRFAEEIERRTMPQLYEQYGNVIKAGAQFTCGPGWEQIIRSVAEKLVTLPGPPRLSGGKEKFGSLILYDLKVIFSEEYDLKGISTRESIEIILEAARKQSVTICEECGQPGRLRIGASWTKTTCDRHAHLVDNLRDDDGDIVDLPPQGGPIYKDGSQGRY